MNRLLESFAEPDSDVYRKVADKDTQERLREIILAHLPKSYRDSFVMVRLLGYSYEEAATILKIHPGTIRSQLHRCGKILKERLENHPTLHTLMPGLNGPP